MKLLNYTYTNLEELNKFIFENDIKNSNKVFIQIFHSKIDDNNSLLQIKNRLNNLLPQSSIMGTSTAGVIENENLKDETILISFSIFEKSNSSLKSYKDKEINDIVGDIKINLIKNNTKLLIIFANTFTFNSTGLLQEITKLFPNIIIAGGNSGDDFNFKSGFVFSNEIDDADVSITAIHSDELKISTNYLLNWETIGSYMTITKCKDNIIYEINDTKAVKIYEEFLGEEVAKNLPESGIEFPLIFTNNHIQIARAPIYIGEDGSIVVAGNIKEGTKVKFGFANIQYIEENNLKNIEKNENSISEAMYIYSCSARRKSLAEYLNDELTLLNNISNSSGFITYGEFFHDMKNSLNFLLNITTTYIALSENSTEPLIIRNQNKKEKSKQSISLKALTHLVNQTTKTTNLLEQYKNTADISFIVSKTDLNGKITYVNDNFEKISGYTKDYLIGKSHSIVKHPEMSPEIFDELWHTVKELKKPWFGRIKNRKRNGTSYYVDTVINPILDIEGNIIEYIAIRRDISEIMNHKKQLIDTISNIDNPTLILIKINNYNLIKKFYSEQTIKKFEKEFSIYFYNIIIKYINVKKIYLLNDGLFGMIKDNYIEKDELIFNLETILEEILNNNIEFEGNKYDIDLIFSFAYKNLQQFDDALIGIEKSVKKNEIIDSSGLFEIEKNKAHDNLKTLTLIRNALKQNNKIVSFYQPIVCNQSKEIIKYESLVRIITNDGNILTPYHFLDIAKMTGYYNEITYKVIKNSFKILSHNKNIHISINLSASDIEDKRTRDLLIDMITKKDNKGRITFELLEDEMKNDLSTVTEFISFSKDIGKVKISIDDFGSGYSNYERLNLFQPDFIKIDGSLIKDIVENKYKQNVLKSIVVFAKENSIKTIAEFVSSEEIYEIVKKIGVDYSQGYFFGKPEPIIL